MTNGLKTQKVTLNIETSGAFSTSFAAMRICPVSRIVLTTPGIIVSGRVDVSVVGRIGNREFIKRADFTKEALNSQSYNLKSNGVTVFDFDFDLFEYDYALLSSIDEEMIGEIYVLVSFGGKEYTARAQINILPSNVWAGLDAEPGMLASFVDCDNEQVEKLCENVCETGKINYSTTSKKQLMKYVKELYKRMKECNIIYTRPVAYGAGSKQRIREIGELFSSSSILATPLEIALVFTSLAKKVGFDTNLVFVRGKKGDIFVLSGISLVKNKIDVSVLENAKKIADLVDNGDMLLIDPSVFAAAQNTSLALALENTAESFVENYSGLVCLVNIEASLKSAKIADKAKNENKGVKGCVADIYSGLVSSAIMQYLAGNKRTEIEEIPLLVPDFDNFFNDNDSNFRLIPLDINSHLEDFAPIDEHFSSIITMSSPKAKQHFSADELSRLGARLAAFKEKISSEGEVTTALRDEELYKVSSEMAFGKNKKETYFTFGYVKITDKLTELVTFAPICLVKADFVYDNGNFYAKQKGAPIVNKVFIRNALKDSALGYDSFMKALMPTDKKEIFDMFENIRMALSETDDRHIYEIIKESHIINAELDDYIFWTNIALQRKSIIASENVRSIFENVKLGEKINKAYVPSIALYSTGMRAVCNETSSLVEGEFTEDKEKVMLALASKNITEGKSTLVVTDDDEMSEYVKNVFDAAALSDLVYVVKDCLDSTEAAEKIKNNIDKYKTLENGSVSFMPKDLTDADSLLLDYSSRLDGVHKTGMTLKEAVKTYLSAGIGTENLDDIYVNKDIFRDADRARVDEIFDLAGSLITEAGKLCRESGLEKHTPIKQHPLYHTHPVERMNDAAKESVLVAIETCLPVLSEYRDTFLDVTEILGIDERQIDNTQKLYMLNDLYKLVLSARDVDIPEKFIESDIVSFAKNKRFANETRKRMQAIEYKLSFFSEEIFEDIENLISGHEYEEEQAGFIKKFMTKKNSQDKLLQYVEQGKKSEFMSHKTADVYKLLYEYKSLFLSLRDSNNEKKEAEETSKLAYVSDKAAEFAGEICKSEGEAKKLLSNIFRLISVIPVDAALARRITVARARLAELYSEETGAFGVISKNMGLNIDELGFENGILSFDGLSKYLTDIKSKIDCTDLWFEWLTVSKRANNVFPEFVKYLENHGVSGNVDRLFAKSLLSPIAAIIKEDKLRGLSKENFGRAKEKYVKLLNNACEKSKSNVLESYRLTMNHLAQTNVIKPEEYRNVEFRELFHARQQLVQKSLPVVVVSKNSLCEALPNDVKFDSVFVLDNSKNGQSMLVALSYGIKAVVFNMSRAGRSELCEKVAESYPRYNVSKFCENRDALLISWQNLYSDEEKVCINPESMGCTELVRMNGTYDRTGTRTNKTEMELALVKATNLIQEGSSGVAITAFTKEQCSAIEKLMCVVCKKNKILDEARKDGKVCVCTPDRLYMKKYDSLVVSTCFGMDKDSRLGWDMGYGSVKICGNIPEGYLAINDRQTNKTIVLTSLNVKDSRLLRRTGNNLSLFTSLCDLLSDGRIPVALKDSYGMNDDAILPEVMAYASARETKMLLCEGKLQMNFAIRAEGENGVYVLVDGERGLCMHDELIVREKIESKGKMVVTLSPAKFAGSVADETLKSLYQEI